MGKRENSTTSKWKKPRKAKADVWKHEDGLVRENALFEKYYALQLPNYLIITDSWEEASKIIAENAGVKIRYKSFLTTTDAVAYLRGAK